MWAHAQSLLTALQIMNSRCLLCSGVSLCSSRSKGSHRLWGHSSCVSFPVVQVFSFWTLPLGSLHSSLDLSGWPFPFFVLSFLYLSIYHVAINHKNISMEWYIFYLQIRDYFRQPNKGDTYGDNTLNAMASVLNTIPAVTQTYVTQIKPALPHFCCLGTCKMS